MRECTFMAKKGEIKREITTARIREDHVDLLDIIADREGLTRTDIIERAVKKFLDPFLKDKCMSCGYLNESGAKFCSQCGEKILKEDIQKLDEFMEGMNMPPEMIICALKDKMKRSPSD